MKLLGLTTEVSEMKTHLRQCFGGLSALSPRAESAEACVRKISRSSIVYSAFIPALTHRVFGGGG